MSDEKYDDEELKNAEEVEETTPEETEETGADAEFEENAGEEAEEEIPEDEAIHAYYDDSISLKDLKQHLGGPIVAVILHVFILIFLATYEMFPPAKPEEPAVEVKMEEMEVEPVPPPPPPQETQPTQETEIEDATFVDMPAERPSVKPDNAPAVAEPVATANTADFGTDLEMDASLPAVDTSRSALKLTGAFAARSGGARALALKKYGGSGNTERAVMKSLAWLAKIQNEDGSWGEWEDNYNQKVQLTCLALLAFLAHGETPQSEEYGEALMKGLKIVLQWNDRGRFEGGTDPNGNIKWNHLDAYAKSRIAIVLAEGYAITKIPALERGMKKAITDIIKGQNIKGGFGEHRDHKTGEIIYHYDLDLGNRLYNAIYCAYHAGCELPELDSDPQYEGNAIKTSIKRSINALSKVHACRDKKGKLTGGFSYGGGGNPNMEATAAGTLFLYLMGYNGKAAKEGYQWLSEYKANNVEGSELKMDWANLPGKTPSLAWYYMTQAMFQGGFGTDENWKKWNRSITRSLLKYQKREGYWRCPADEVPQFKIVRVNKSTNPKKPRWVEEKQEVVYNESENGGFTQLNSRIWSTVYFTLTLEVYYRYLPTFQPDGKTRTPLAGLPDSEDAASGGDSGDKSDSGDSEDSISLD